MTFLLFSPSAPSPVSSISVKTPAELQASKGDAVALSCTFISSSTPTSKMTVDWSYRPQSGGPPQTVSWYLSGFNHFYTETLVPWPCTHITRVHTRHEVRVPWERGHTAFRYRWNILLHISNFHHIVQWKRISTELTMNTWSFKGEVWVLCDLIVNDGRVRNWFSHVCLHFTSAFIGFLLNKVNHQIINTVVAFFLLLICCCSDLSDCWV